MMTFVERLFANPSSVGIGALLSVLVLVVCGCAPGRQNSRNDGATRDGGCFLDPQNGVVRINPSCVRSDVGVKSGLKLADLGTVGVATFDASARIQRAGSASADTRTGAEGEGITGVVVRQLLKSGLTLVNREPSATDGILRELNMSTSGLVDSSTAPSIGKHLGLKTLFVGRYELEGVFDVTTDDDGMWSISGVRTISKQAIRIKALDVEKGIILVDASFTLTGWYGENGAQALAKYGMMKIFEEFGASETVF